MPYISTNYSGKITPAEEEKIKTELGKAVSVLGKTESWLMVGFIPECSIYFRGEKPEKAAFVDVNLYGSASPSAYSDFTGEICRIFGDVLGIPADKIYVRYSPTDNWGWNGSNF